MQVFDSWAGILTPRHYRGAGPAGHQRGSSPSWPSPTPGSPPSSSGWAPASCWPSMATAGSAVVGIDWRVPLDEARRRVGPGIAVQGNLDPAMCLTTWEVAAAETREVLDRAGTEPGPRLQPRPRGPPRDRSGHPRAGGRAGPRRGTGRRGGRRVSRAGRPGRSGCWSWPTGPPPRRRASNPSTPPSGAAGLRLPSSWPSWWAATRPSAGPRRSPSGPAPRSTGWPRPWRPRRPAGSWCATGPSSSRRPSRRGWPTLVGAGVGRVVGLVLTPHQSSLGSGEYLRRAARGGGRGRPAAGPDPDPVVAPGRRASPGCWPARTEAALASLDAADATPDGGVLHRPQPPPAGGGPRAIPTRPRWPSPPPTSPGWPGWTGCPASPGAWPGRARGGRPTRGSGPTC